MSDWPPRGPRSPLGDPVRVATLVLALAGGVVAVLVATGLFPYHSLNHDEAVYLQQADLLRHGRVFLRPPVEDAFRPWFFVESPRGLYAKYTPLPAAVFALGDLLGGYTLGLAAVAAALVGGVVALGRELFDARVGVLAGLFLLATPLFVVHSGVFLPYAVTTALNVAFAVAYLRAERRGSRRDAAVAGVAVGLAFFARPYTAVLFALPFVAHAAVTLRAARPWRALGARSPGRADARALLTRRLVTGTLGSAGVLATLGYNAAVTGDPFLFPYLAFAPMDGIGFGERAILGHEVAYTPGLAVRANARVLAALFTEWVVAGTAGAAAAAVGVALALARGAGHRRVRRGLLAATFGTVAAGNLAFWGNYNILGTLAAPNDGLIAYLGPYYHYDLVVPTAVFAAVAVVAAFDRGRAVLARAEARGAVGARRGRALAAVVVLLCAALAVGVGAAAVDDAVAPNTAVTAEYRAGYAPFADGGPPAESVLFLPTPYGPWLNHPFQVLRNSPDYDGRVYALRGERDLTVAAAFPDRDLYRYVYAGSWVPTDDSTVRAAVVPVARVAGDRVVLDATVDRPASVERTTVRVTTDRGSAYLVAADAGGPLSLSATVTDGRVTVVGPALVSREGTASVPLADADEVRIEVFVATGPTGGYSYEVAFPVERSGERVRALSPTVERCPVPTRCVPQGVGSAPPDRGVDVSLTNATAAG